MRCLKSFGERIASRDPDRQLAEIHIRILRGCARTRGACRPVINRFNALGRAESGRIACAPRGKGPPRGNRDFRNNARVYAWRSASK